MITITQLIYLKAGQEKVFEEFENQAIPLISKYGGSLQARIRPTPECWLDGPAERPYEVHIVNFPSEEQFLSFMKDPSRTGFLHLKEQAVQHSILYKGIKI